MRLPQYFIDRPIFATVLSVVITLLGVLAINRLPISEYPEVVPPSIQITAAYPGASPETVNATVAGPLEQQMTGLKGLLYQGSQSTPDGTMQLVLTFALGTDLDSILTEVQNRIQRATPRLPEEVRRLGVIAEKSSPNILMVVGLYTADGGLSTLDMANLARQRVRDQLMRIDGVSDAPVFGAGEYAMRVWLDPERMAARSLTPGDVVGAIREQNVQVAAGSLGQQPLASPTGFELTITTQGRLSEPAEFANIVVRRDADGRMIRLGEVARVEIGASTYGIRSLLNNQASVAIPIFQSPGSNALDVSDGVRKTMKQLEGSLAASGVKWEVIYDPTEFIRTSIEAVVVTLLEAIALVVLVVIIFLQTWRASIIPLIAVPVSIIGTFAIMIPLGFTINALTLFGLVLAIGIVVDDAIVVVENVERNIANGLSPRDATRQAMREVSGPILATALVLGSVFIPTAFISGLTGQFYQQFALTIAISTIISAFNSLTLSPALAALLLRPHKPGHSAGGLLFGWFFRLFNRGFAAAGNGYVATTRGIVRKAGIALVFYVALVGAGGWLFNLTPTSFIPAQDKGYLFAITKLPDGASLDRTDTAIREMGRIALAHPAVERVVQFPGLSPTFVPQSNFGIMFIGLKPYDQRPAGMPGVGQILGELGGQYAGIPDALCFVLPPPPILGLGESTGFKLFLQDRGNLGIAALFDAAGAISGAAMQDPALSQAFTYSSIGTPRVNIDIDKEQILAQGLRLSEVYDALNGYFGQYYANDFNRFNRTYQVTVSADASYRSTVADIARIKIRNGAGMMVPLSAFVTVRESGGPDRMLGYNTYLALDIQGAAKPGRSGDEAKAAMEALLAKTLPPGIGYEWTDLTYQQDLAGNTAIYVFPMCVLLVFLVLAAFYESMVLPLAIIMIVPLTLLAALGGIWLMALAGLGMPDNNIMTQIGLIVLVGLACKNAILVVEFARDAEIHRGLKPYDAVLEACRLRLRPVLMTSIAFILGVLPLVLSSGAGAELRQATGVVVFFGMIGVTLFGLNFTPVFYYSLRRLFSGPLHNAHDREEQDEAEHVAELAAKASARLPGQHT